MVIQLIKKYYGHVLQVRKRAKDIVFYEIAVFTKITDDFKFTKDGEDFRKKVIIGELY